MASGASERINAAACRERFDTFYAAWDTLPQLQDCDAVCFLVGKAKDDEDALSRMGLFHLWSFMLIFPDTLIVLMRDKRIAFAARAKKLAYFEELETGPVGEAYKLLFFPRDPALSAAEHLRKSGLADVLKGITPGQNEATAPLIGTLLHPSVLPHGAAAESLISILGFPENGISDLDDNGFLTTKLEESDVRPNWRWRAIDDDVTRITLRLNNTTTEYARLAALASARMAREVVVNQVIDTLDKETKKAHLAICAAAENALDEGERGTKWKNRYGIDIDAIDVGACLVESGTAFTLNPCTSPSNDNLWLGKGSICIGIGLKYHNHLGFLARTILMDLGEAEQGFYQAALDLQKFAISAVKPGRKCCEIYQSIWEYAVSKYPDLSKHLQKNFGGPVGLQLQLPEFSFNETSQQPLDPGMAVVVTVAAPNIRLGGSTTPFAIWLGDTFPVPATSDVEADPTKLWTSSCTKQMADILFVEDNKAGEPESAKENRTSSNTSSQKRSEPPTRSPAKSARHSPGVPVGPRSRSRRVAAGVSHQEQEKLLQKQRELRKRKQREITERFREGEIGFSEDKKSVRKLTHLTAYRDVAEFPKDLRPSKLAIDQVKEAVLIPIGALGHVPFHVSTIRKVVHQDEDGTKNHVLRISFNVPGSTALGAKTEESPLPDLSNTENALFVKEIMIKSQDAHLANQVKILRELMKKVRTKELNRQEDELTQQHALQLSRTGHRRLLLRNLMVRHSGAHSRRMVGTLEAHQNGFRYSAPRSENIDIIYSNIRYAFYQPVHNELMILLHFHLKSPILIQKKRVKDIQYYCEISSQADDLDARRNRSAYDPDEILEEEREYERKQKLNMEFKRFVEQVQELANLEFEIPLRNFSFHGVPKNSSVILTPTQNCLVSLVDWPAFILPMEDVEIVSFERVIHGLRHFDAVFVFKDYLRPVQTVATIPVESLDMLKSWLNEMEIVWYEGKPKLSWPAILKTIRADLRNFVAENGFDSFLGEESEPGEKGSEESEGEDSSDEDEEYQESSAESSEASDEGSSEEDEDASDEGSEEEANSDAGSESDEDSEEEDEMALAEINKSKRKGAVESRGAQPQQKRRRRD